MYDPVKVDKGRTCKLAVSIGEDVSNDTFTSEIRTEAKQSSTLIVTWSIGFLTDGTDGELVLTLTDLETSDIPYSNGFMDIKRISNGEAVKVWDDPIEVIFKEVVTE